MLTLFTVQNHARVEIMKFPEPKFVKKNPSTFRCPACSKTFCISSYPGKGMEKVYKLEADYEKHFAENHTNADFPKTPGDTGNS